MVLRNLQRSSALEEVLPGRGPIVGVARRQPQAARHGAVHGRRAEAVQELGAGAVANDLDVAGSMDG